MPEGRELSGFSRSPLLWIAVCFAVGILCARSFDLTAVASAGLTVTLGVAAVFLRGRTAGTAVILAAFVFAGVLAAGIEISSIRLDRLKVIYDSGAIASGEPVEIEGTLLSTPEPTVDGCFLLVKVEKLAHRGTERIVSGRVRIFVPKGDERLADEPLILRYGSHVKIATRLEREDEFLNPGVARKREILDRIGIDATGAIESPLMIEKIADEGVFLPLAWVYDQRARLIEIFRDNLSPTAAGVMIASLLGDKHFLDKETGETFREGGTFHILVISGLHITFIGGILVLIVRTLTRSRWAQFFITTSVLWAYTLAVGADVPVVRAALMFTILLLSYAVFRRTALLNGLGASGLILLAWRPSGLFDPSFQLTFVSVGAIVALAYPLVRRLHQIGTWTPTRGAPFPPNVPGWLRRLCETVYWDQNRWEFDRKRQIWTATVPKSPYSRLEGVAQRAARYLFEGVLVSFIVQASMLPLSIVYFHRVSLISVLLNIWVGIFIAVESFAAVAGATVLHFNGVLARGFFALAESANWLMLFMPRSFSEIEPLSFRLPAYSGAGRAVYVLYAVPVLAIAVALNRWRPFHLRRARWLRPVFYSAVVIATLLGGIAVFHPFSAPTPDGRLKVDFLDVGQGDAALVTFPDGRTLLVDGGGTFKYRDDEGVEAFEPDVQGIGERVVSQFLWERGYARLDHILATHADADHLDGLIEVAQNFEIGSVLIGSAPSTDPRMQELVEVARRRGFPVEVVERGDVLEFGRAAMSVLHPEPNNASSANDGSVVLRLTFGERAFLLTGDIEKAAEAGLSSTSEEIRSDVVKVPHHGSRTSSTLSFLERVNADIAVISVGRRSPFGHPHAEVTERWELSGSRTIRTGDRGTVTVSTDGNDVVVTTFVP